MKHDRKYGTAAIVTAFMEQSGDLLDPMLRLSVERGGKPEGTLKSAAVQLTQGCYILKALLFPPIDAILTDMDYLFS
ncbi:hypothetical protein I8J29_30470 [Paenibacillus sp. MWE-103]|uniref:Uncharacterized protein n=1 Tax=Paenibacillus artemisiicola TaxID=1172618 RepID=A0ABS3WJJ9_9BACL|nr:hypothetical protein [Paenibacillus artemisiicola]MBO7748508.1 hypothetical protein [Paenibacillus artemisiicola]